MLAALITWTAQRGPNLTFATAQLRADGHLRALVPETASASADRQNLPAEAFQLRTLFSQTLGGAPSEDLLLLDVSSNADQLGVGLGFRDQPLLEPTDLTIQNTELASYGFNVRVFTLPQGSGNL